MDRYRLLGHIGYRSRYVRKLLRMLAERIGVDPTFSKKVSPISEFVFLGSEYGAWGVDTNTEWPGQTVFLAGVGEDASFDIALAERGAKVIAIDPTPRAISYWGQNIPDELDMTLVESALWDTPGELELFIPADSEHVSHSALNLQNTDSSISVPCTTYSDLVAEYGAPALLKMDIEGAELRVISSMLRDPGSAPDFLCVEFDELHAPSDSSYIERVRSSMDELQESGYVLELVNHGTDYHFRKADSAILLP